MTMNKAVWIQMGQGLFCAGLLVAGLAGLSGCASKMAGVGPSDRG